MVINDCIKEALGSGQINDLLLQYYQANGATSSNLMDAEREFLLIQGATPAVLNDMWFEFLRDKLYLGSLDDMLYQFWCDDDGVIP